MPNSFAIFQEHSLPAAVTALEAAQAGVPGYGRPWTAGEMTATLEAGGRLWIARTNDETSNEETVLGFLLLGREGDDWFIAKTAVAELYRRRGAGRQLLFAAVESCRPEIVWLEVAAGNTPARALYSAFGFSEIRRRKAYYADGSDAVVMRLDSPA